MRDFRIRDQIQIALPVARLHVFEAMPLLRHGEQRLRQELELLHMHAQLAGARAEQIALGADQVADIENLKQPEIIRADGIAPDIYLELLAVLREVRETRLCPCCEWSSRVRRCGL